MGFLVRRNGNLLWDPFDFWGEVREEMKQLKSFHPHVDVAEEKEAFVVKADLPGIKKEDLEVKVEGRFLTLKGERKEEKETKEKNYFSSERTYGSFVRVLEMPSDVKAEEIKAGYKDGVLEVRLPKTESAKTKQITVEVK